VRTGSLVYGYRCRLVGPLLLDAAKHCRTFLETECRFQYRAGVPQDEPVLDAGQLTERFRSGLEKTRSRSVVLKRTIVGPHRDDITVHCGERELKRFGSVGEQRLAAVALRLAEAELISRARSDRPVLLLDEIVAELDERRSRLVLDLVSGWGQVVYAAARHLQDGAQRPGSEDRYKGKLFHVQAGQIEEAG